MAKRHSLVDDILTQRALDQSPGRELEAYRNVSETEDVERNCGVGAVDVHTGTPGSCGGGAE